MNSFLKKRGLNRMDLCYLAALTLIGLGIRVILRVVITDDWLMYWDPWISDLKEMGFSYLATDRYDYTPTFVYILWVISRLPINPMTAYKGLHCVLDFVAAGDFGQNDLEGHRKQAQGRPVLRPVSDCAHHLGQQRAVGPVRHYLYDLFAAVLLLPV